MDGFTIVLTKAQNYLVSGGGFIGYGDMPNAVVAEADFWYNGDFYDISSNSVSIHQCIYGKCNPYENVNAVQSNIGFYSYSVWSSHVLKLKLAYFNKSLYLYFNGVYMISYPLDIETVFASGVFIGFTTFYRGNSRTLKVRNANFCTTHRDALSFLVSYNFNKDLVPPGRKLSINLQLKNSLGDKFENFFDYPGYFYTLTISCPGSSISHPYYTDKVSLTTDITSCTQAGTYTLTGYISFYIYRININETMKFVADSYDKLTGITVLFSGKSCSNVQNINGASWLKCGENDGNFSSEEFVNKITFRFKVQDIYGNEFAVTNRRAAGSVSFFTSSDKKLENELAINNVFLDITVGGTENDDYYITSSKFENQFINNRLYFKVESSLPDLSYSLCRFKDISGGNPNIVLGSNVIYVCELLNKNRKKVDVKNINALLSKNKLYCIVDGSTVLGNSTNEDGIFICNVGSNILRYPGNYSINPKYDSYSIKTAQNEFTVLAYPRDFNGMIFKDFVNNRNVSFPATNRIQISMGNSILQCIEFMVNDRPVNGFYASEFLAELKGEIRYLEQQGPTAYQVGRVTFTQGSYGGSKCILLNIESSSTVDYLRRTTFDYQITIRLTNSEAKINLFHVLNGVDQASAFPLDISSTNVELLSGSDSITLSKVTSVVNKGLNLFRYSLRSNTKVFYNYPIDQSKFRIDVSCTKEKLTRDQLFNPLVGYIEGQLIITSKPIRFENNCRISVIYFDVNIHSYDLIFIPENEAFEVEMIENNIKTEMSNEIQVSLKFKLKDQFGNNIRPIEVFRERLNESNKFIAFLNYNNVIKRDALNLTYNIETKIFEISEKDILPGIYNINFTYFNTRKQMQFSYIKLPGSVDINRSIINLTSNRMLEEIGFKSTFEVVLKDKTGIDVTQNIAYAQEQLKKLELKVKKYDKEEYLTVEGALKNGVFSFFTQSINDRYKYFYELKYDGKIVPCDVADCSFRIKFKEIDFDKTSVYVEKEGLKYKLEKGKKIQIFKPEFKTYFNLQFFDKNNERVNDLNLIDYEFIGTLSYDNDNFYLNNEVNKEGLDIKMKTEDVDKYNQLNEGIYKLKIQYSNKSSSSDIRVGNFEISLKNTKPISDFELIPSNTIFSDSQVEIKAGDTKKISFTLMDENGTAVKLKSNFVNTFKLKINEEEQGEKELKNYIELDSSIYKIDLNQESNFIISLYPTKTQKTSLILEKDNTSYGKILMTVVNHEEIKLLHLVSTFKEKTQNNFIIDDIIAGKVKELIFTPKDVYGNIVSQIFSEKFYSLDQIKALFSISSKDHNGNINSDLSGLNAKVQLNNSNNEILLLVSCNKVGSVEVSTIYNKFSIIYEIKPAELSITNTTFNILKQSIIAGEKNSIEINFFDLYKNSLLYQPYIQNLLVEALLPSGKSLKIDSGNNVYSEEFTLSGITGWQIKYLDNIIHSSNFKVNHGPVDLNNTIISCQKLEGNYEPCKAIEITAQVPLALLLSYSDKFKNLIPIDLTNEITISDVVMDGHDMPPFTQGDYNINFINNGSQTEINLNSNAKADHIYLVSGKNYSLRFTINSKGNQYKVQLNIVIKSPVDDSKFGNGPFIVENSTFSFDSFSFIKEVKETVNFTVTLKTIKGLIYNRFVDESTLKLVSDGDLIDSKITKSIEKGSYNVEISGKKNSSNEDNKPIFIEISVLKNKKFEPYQTKISFIATPKLPPKILLAKEFETSSQVVKVGEIVDIRFQLKDEFENIFTNKHLSGNDNFDIKIKNFSPKDIFRNYDVFKKRWSISFYPEYPPYKFNANVIFKKEKHYFDLISKEVEPSFEVKIEIDHSKYEVLGSNIEEMIAGDKLNIYIQAFDEYYKCFNLESDQGITVQIEGDNNFSKSYGFKVTDNKFYVPGVNINNCQKILTIQVADDNIYTKAGEYKIYVKRNNSIIIKKYNQVVYPAAFDSQKTIVKWNNTGNFSKDSLVAGTKYYFTVQAKDKYNNNAIESIQSKFKVLLKSQDNDAVVNNVVLFENIKVVEIQGEELKPGLMSFTFTINKIGDFYFEYQYIQVSGDVKINPNNSEGPAIVTVAPSNCDIKVEESKRLNKSNLAQVIVGEKQIFEAICFDQFTNKITKGGEEFDVRIVIKDNQGVIYDTNVLNEIKDKGNGTYTMSFIPAKVANYFITIKLRNKDYASFNVVSINSICDNEKVNKIECPNNKIKCVDDIKKCLDTEDQNNCKDPLFPFYCEDDLKKLACRKSQSECACEPGFTRCSGNLTNNICVPKDKLYMCPFYMKLKCNTINKNFKILCFDGICRTDQKNCSNKRVCPIGSVLCPDLSCAESSSKCIIPKECSKADITCPDQTCVKDQKDCPSMVTCKNSNLVVCPDGSCVENEIFCQKLAKCVAPNIIRCSNNVCVSNATNCPKLISCGHGLSLCSDMICRAECTS